MIVSLCLNDMALYHWHLFIGTLFLRPQSPANFLGSGSASDFVYSPSKLGGVSSSRSWFTYEELIQATNGFSAQNLLGEGGFGFQGL